MFCQCGTGSFKHVDEDQPGDIGLFGGGSPKGRKKKRPAAAGKLNPYAGRGLDRFSVVLSELESRRARILHRVVGSDTADCLVMIRFVQSEGGWAPIVVKLREDPLFKGTKKRTAAASASAAVQRHPSAASNSTAPPNQIQRARPKEGAAKKMNATARARARSASFSWLAMRRPSGYLPAFVVLTLVSLAVFGRMFAISLASIWWYLLPTLGSRGYSHGASPRRRTRTLKTKLDSPPQHAEMRSSCGVDEVVSWPGRHAKKGKTG